LDSNQRRLSPTGLQPVPFSHSGTDPNIRLRIIIHHFYIVKKAKEKIHHTSHAGAVREPSLLIFPRD
jgi:hypothetical protein